MASYDCFSTTSESWTSLEYNSSNLKVEIKVIYDNDTEKRMQVNDEPEVQPQHKFHLKMSGTGFYTESTYDYSEIKDYVSGIEAFLAEFVNSGALIMKMVRCISFHLNDRGSNVIHMVPGTEELQIRKVEHGKMSPYNYSSNPTLDIMPREECDQINRFVGYHPTKPWLDVKAEDPRNPDKTSIVF